MFHIKRKCSSVLKSILRKKYYNAHGLFYFSGHSKVRVRFAPSPTGLLHLGGARTALYNYLFAKLQNGEFILRIEDTDSSRNISGAVQEIEKDLQWLSIYPSESPSKGGSFGPYIQSQRKKIYEKHVDTLLQNGTAYKCFCSEDRLASLKRSFSSYDNHCRDLTSDHHKKFGESKSPYCIRLKINTKPYQLNDLIYGERTFQMTESDGDPVIVKTNGIPTYHFANVVDDHTMGITHVIRGVDWIGTIPIHLMLYEYFNWNRPNFAHVPQILNADGTKLSKRQNDLNIQKLRLQGYSPEVVLNFIKLTGGGFLDIDHERITPMTELIQKFRLELINTHPAPLDMMKLKNYNRLDFQNKILNKGNLKIFIEELREDVMSKFSTKLDVNLSDQYLEEVLLWSQNRIYVLRDLTTSDFSFLWSKPVEFNCENIKNLNLDSESVLLNIIEHLSSVNASNFESNEISSILKNFREKHKIKTIPLMQLLRYSTCGTKVGPPVSEVFALLGKERSLARLSSAHSFLK